MAGYEKGAFLQKIRARSLAEATEKLFSLYKWDYEIKSKRQILVGGFLGFGQHEEIEVSYITKNRSDQVSLHPSMTRMSAPSAYEDFNKSRDEILKKNSVNNTLLASKINTLDKKLEKLEKLDELSKHINEITSKLQSVSASSGEVHSSIKKIETLLEQNEFSISFINKIKERIIKTFSLEQLDDFSLVEKNVVDWIGESILITPERVFRKPHVVIIVGPTGVGKTTTLVKLAAQYFLTAKKEGKKLELCFVTTDTMRVGAMEQLLRFGDILGIKVLKAEQAADVKKLYEDYKDTVDAIFIDTSGYSPNDAEHIGIMKMMLDVKGLNPDVYLAVTASTKARDLNKIIQNYEPFGYRSVIITKCDESEQYGNVISVLNERHKSISYITNGQVVAKTISKASIIDFLIRLEDFNIDRVHIEDKFGEN